MTLHLRLTLTIALLSLWLGAATIVAFSVAPAAFDIMPRSSAGDLIGRALSVVFASGLLISVFVAGLTAAGARTRYVFAAIMAVACGTARFVLDPRIAALRASRSAAALVPDGTPYPPGFGTLHALSVGALGVAMLVALTLIILALRDLQRPSESIHG